MDRGQTQSKRARKRVKVHLCAATHRAVPGAWTPNHVHISVMCERRRQTSLGYLNSPSSMASRICQFDNAPVGAVYISSYTLAVSDRDCRHSFLVRIPSNLQILTLVNLFTTRPDFGHKPVPPVFVFHFGFVSG